MTVIYDMLISSNMCASFAIICWFRFRRRVIFREVTVEQDKCVGVWGTLCSVGSRKNGRELTKHIHAHNDRTAFTNLQTPQLFTFEHQLMSEIVIIFRHKADAVQVLSQNSIDK